MSLELVPGRKKKLIPVAHVGETTVAYNPKVPKEHRVKEMFFKELVKPFPYIDVAHNQRSATFISGVSGSGKSTAGVALIRRLRERRNDLKRPVEVFTTSSLPDPAYSTMAHVEFINVEDPRFMKLDIEDLSGRIVVFDDYENVADPRLSKYLLHFMKKVLEQTRKQETDVIVINHMSQNYHATRNIIFECDTFYLNVAQNRVSAGRFLSAYSSIPKTMLAALLAHEFDDPFGFVVFHKCAPCYIIFENVVKLIN